MAEVVGEKQGRMRIYENGSSVLFTHRCREIRKVLSVDKLDLLYAFITKKFF
jgi:hypothetical protein